MSTLQDKINARKAKQAQVNQATARNNGPANNERVPAEFFLNLGAEITIADDGTEMEDPIFVSAISVALDTQNVSTFGGRKEDRQFLFDEIMAMAESLEPGQAETFLLPVQIRRRGEPKEVSGSRKEQLNIFNR